MKALLLFRRFRIRLVLLLVGLALLSPLELVWAETVKVPVQLRYPILRQLLILNMFRGPGGTSEISGDPAGCTKVILSDPQLTGGTDTVSLAAKGRATLGMLVEDDCLTVLEWMGQVQVEARPVIVPERPPAIGFEVSNVTLYNQQGERLTEGILQGELRDKLPSVLGLFRVDLAPSLEELKAFLPLVLPRHSAGQVKQLIDSLRLTGVRADSDHLTVDLSFKVDAPSAPEQVTEPSLTAEELERWEERWESWDAFLTFIIKWLAETTESIRLRAALLEILLDARYEFRNALVNEPDYQSDPVRQLFLRSWQRLAPVLEEISATLPGQEALAIVALITAGDALETLDRLGPAIGLEISAAGLRRLARLLSDSPDMDPLRYADEVDPELRQLFGFEPLDKENAGKEPPRLNFRFIRPVFAGEQPAQAATRLNKWAPTRAELDQYLPLVRELLIYHSGSLLGKAKGDPAATPIYPKLLLATAWQESCWRQYTTEKGKVVPLRSNSGDVGLMQINERVWRGFYAIPKLQWDINYNARAGSEILLKYLVAYALPKGEHKRGNVHDLARATYSAYNGGPGQVSRYRNPGAPEAHKKIDAAFWKKYQAVQNGREYDVAECLGGTPPTPNPASLKPSQKQAPQKGSKEHPPASKRQANSDDIKREKWILAQDPKHFTLQVAAFGTEKASREFILKQKHPGRFAYYTLSREAKSLFAVVYGTFANRSSAEKEMPALGLNKPWVRDFDSLHKIIKAR